MLHTSFVGKNRSFPTYQMLKIIYDFHLADYLLIFILLECFFYFTKFVLCLYKFIELFRYFNVHDSFTDKNWTSSYVIDEKIIINNYAHKDIFCLIPLEKCISLR